jgi:hypothetical protein
LAPSSKTKPYFLEDALGCETYENLVKRYGAENLVKSTDIYVGDGQTVKGTLIFPETPDELEVLWEKDKAFKRIVEVKANLKYGRDDQPQPSDRWQHRNSGLHLGMTMAEVVKINGKDFSISGFGWDFGGFVTSFEGGKLDKQQLTLRFDENDSVGPDEGGQVSGEVDLFSSHPVLIKMKPRVSSLALSTKTGSVL